MTDASPEGPPGASAAGRCSEAGEAGARGRTASLSREIAYFVAVAGELDSAREVWASLAGKAPPAT